MKNARKNVLIDFLKNRGFMCILGKVKKVGLANPNPNLGGTSCY